ncbi:MULTISPECIES: chitinase [Glycomyces]|uniref:chitinase n=2 Tax=Glycomyces TaxID=58113 RepID=A0A9X3PNN9_9ACTN|nr:glycosyl hydrolase family 18 protein [Glycomyces lechevalierae]MDA1386392.1 glycosyl hydrolase family 18 protein [Glycomyces lechevalierae]MDR7338908.1 chitinase [Glycomyces lechevalierae]
MGRIRRTAVIAAATLAAAGAAVAVPIALAGNASAETACTAAAWAPGEVYVGGDEVSHAGREYRAKWWTTGETPGTTGEWGVWQDLGACGGAEPTTPGTGSPTAQEPTGEPTEQPTGEPGQGNAHLTGYWHNFDNGSGVMELNAVPAAYDIIAVAFAESTTTPGRVDFALDSSLTAAGYTEAEFKADITALRAAGRHVVISVGGEKGNVTVNDGATASAFSSSVLALMNEYGFDGVDIDLEHGINAPALETALRAIDAAKPGFTYTMAPQTIDFQSTSAGYYQLAVNTKDLLTIVNMQYYNSGSMLGCDGRVYAQGDVDFLTAQACIQLEAGLDPGQVGLGLPAVSSAAGSGYVDPAMVNAALDCLATLANCGDFKPDQAYPGIGGAMTWSINWDKTSGYKFANTVAGHFPNLP